MTLSQPCEPAPLLLVACLCAAWCSTCRDYRSVFEGLQAEFLGRADFVWVDIEDEAELLGVLDIEDFPTLLIAHKVSSFDAEQSQQVLFFGPVLPLRATLQQLIQRASSGPLVSGVDDRVLTLTQRLAQSP